MRPPHIHFKISMANFKPLTTQMYFPGDPLLQYDPIFNSTPDEKARSRLIAKFSMDVTEPDWALGYEFDIVLRGRDQTPVES